METRARENRRPRPLPSWKDVDRAVEEDRCNIGDLQWRWWEWNQPPAGGLRPGAVGVRQQVASSEQRDLHDEPPNTESLCTTFQVYVVARVWSLFPFYSGGVSSLLSSIAWNELSHLITTVIGRSPNVADRREDMSDPWGYLDPPQDIDTLPFLYHFGTRLYRYRAGEFKYWLEMFAKEYCSGGAPQPMTLPSRWRHRGLDVSAWIYAWDDVKQAADGDRRPAPGHRQEWWRWIQPGQDAGYTKPKVRLVFRERVSERVRNVVLTHEMEYMPPSLLCSIVWDELSHLMNTLRGAADPSESVDERWDIGPPGPNLDSYDVPLARASEYIDHHYQERMRRERATESGQSTKRQRLC